MSEEIPMFDNAANKMKKKRNRIPLSCTICRKRKVKCDKTRPHCEQCSKTGVSHLCHYMEQTWAEEAEKEIYKESEIKILKDRVRALEEALARAQQASSYSQTPDSDIVGLETNSLGICDREGEAIMYAPKKHDKDELDLTRQFDMLHLRNNGIIHLGATHWMAIMKGDPYLKLLWGHIFTIKEKLAEWYGQKQTSPNASSTKCPITHASARPCCPVNHSTVFKQPESSISCPMSSSKQSSLVKNRKSLSKCPANHMMRVVSSTSLPSFKNLTSKCPVLHDAALPGIQEAISTSETSESNSGENYGLGYMQTVRKICDLLPPKRIICMFMEKFFKHIYPVIPIIDQSIFTNHINYILYLNADMDGEDVTDIRMNTLADFCNLGILVIILRITWWSLPVNACKIDLGPQGNPLFMAHATASSTFQAKEEEILASHTTPSEALALIRENLINFDQISSVSNSNVNLTTIQFAIFYKLYLMCWSNDNSGNGKTTSFHGGDTQDNEPHQVLFSSITQMAFSCGLHRDPDNFPQLTKVPYAHIDDVNLAEPKKSHRDAMTGVERFKHTWRKTWYYIVSLDVQQSLSLGTPRLLRNLNDFSDTKLPTASKLDYVSDIKELVIIKNTSLFFKIDLCIIAVLNHVLNVSVAKNIKKSQLDFLISSLNDLTDNRRSACQVLNGLINSGMLHSSEGAFDNDPENSYELPSLNDLLSYPGTSEEFEKKVELTYESTTKALFFSKHLTLRMLLYLLNYILFTHYEPLGAEDPKNAYIAKSYAQEALNYAMDGYRNCLFFFTNVGLGSTSDSMLNYMEVILAPQCLDIGHRSLQFIVCLILRAKCGPLAGMGEGVIITNNSDNNDIHQVENSEENEGINYKKKGESGDVADCSEDEINLDTSDRLADTLFSKMVLFHKMTRQLCAKYRYAHRTMKSVGFFIALLRGLTVRNKHDDNKNDNKKESLTALFKNVPSLMLSGDGEQLKRCPVYQDAVGFVTPANNNRAEGIFAFESGRSGLHAPLSKAYKPITYIGSSVRTECQDTGQFKRRHLNDGPLLNASDIASTSVPTASSVADILPPIARELDSSRQMDLPSRSELMNGTKSGITETSLPPSEKAPNAFVPTFEDFLMENSSFNGIMLNPSSIVEAVGFQDFRDVDMLLGTDELTDFLPLDNTGIEGLGDPNPIQLSGIEQ